MFGANGVIMKTKLLAEVSVIDETNPAVLYLLELSTAAGRRAQRSALLHFLRWAAPSESLQTFAWSQLRPFHVLAYRDFLMERLKAKTVNRYLSAVRGVIKQAWLCGQIEAEIWARVREVRSMPGKSLPAGRELQDAEIRAMLEVAGKQKRRWYRSRDIAILSLLYCSGMRRAEVAALQFGGIVENGPIVNFSVMGKGRRERLIPVSVGFLGPINEWIKSRGAGEGPLFFARRDSTKEIGADTVTRLVIRCARKAGISNASPHDFRRTYGTRLLDAGADLVAVSRLLGHAALSTTQVYDRRGERAKIAAAMKLQPF